MSDLVVSTGNNPKFSTMSQQVRIAPGTWWETRDEWNNMPAGTYVLVEDVAVADGSPHHVTLATPPSAVSDSDISQRSGRHWLLLVEEFVAAFLPVDQAVAAASRAAELLEVQNRIAAIQTRTADAQSELTLIATQSTALPGIFLSSDQESDSRTSRTDLAATAAKDIQSSVKAITVASEIIKVNAEIIGKQTARMSLYYAEQAQAAMASLKPAMMVVGRLQERVATLGLYAGKDVKAALMVDGLCAPAEEKLTLLQRRLYLDEELLIHLDSGGADYRDIGSLASALSSDPGLVERIFSAPRCVVVMSSRRNAKERILEPNATVGAIMKQIAEEQADQRSFLLVRDGGKIWIVNLPDVLSGIERMFPTPQDLEAPYTQSSWYSHSDRIERIGPDNLKYAKASEEFRQMAVHYERVLILLWGLHDRLGIFGPFAENSDYTNFSDPRLQKERFHLVFDDQMLLGQNRPSYKEWLLLKNNGLRSGSRVAVRWHGAMTPESAPGAVETRERNGNYRTVFKYKPVHEHSIATVRRDGVDFVVDAPVIREVLNPKNYTCHNREINARVSLSKIEPSTSNFSYLVLDDVDADDVDYYLESRTERENYLGYVPVLFTARRQLRLDDIEQSDARTELESMAIAGRLQAPETGWPRAVREAVRDWRADNKGVALPRLDSKDWPRARKALLGKIWVLAGRSNEDALIDEVAEICNSSFSTPLRVSRDGNNRVVLYSKVELDSGPYKEMIGTWPLIERSLLKRGRDGKLVVDKSREIICSPALVASEHIVHEFESLPYDKPINGISDGGRLRALLDGVLESCRQTNLIFDTNPDQEHLCQLVKEISITSRARSRQSVYRPMLIHPIGLFVKHDETNEYWDNNDSPLALSMVAVATDAWKWVATHANAQTRSELVMSIENIYRNPGIHVDSLPAYEDSIRTSMISIPLKNSIPDLSSRITGAVYEPDNVLKLYNQRVDSTLGMVTVVSNIDDSTCSLSDIVRLTMSGEKRSALHNAKHRWISSQALDMVDAFSITQGKDTLPSFE